MDFNDDDESSAPTAKPAFKFQPKAKAKVQAKAKARVPPPKKVTPAAKPSVPQQAADNQLIASPTKTKEMNEPNNGISDNADPSNLDTISKIPVEQTTNLQTSSRARPLLSSMENLSTITPGHVEENANSKESANQHCHSGELMIEVAEGFVELDSLDEILPQSTTVADGTFDTSNSHNGEDIPSPFFHMETVSLETQEGQGVTSFDSTSEVGASSGKKASKFQPKLKQKHSKKAMANASASDPKQTLIIPPETQNGAPETQNTNEGSVDGGSPDIPHVRIDDAFSTNPHDEGLLDRLGSVEASPDFISDPPSCSDATTDCFLNQTSELPQSSSDFIHDNSTQQDASFSAHMHLQPVPSVSEAENNNSQSEDKGGSKKRKASKRSNKDKDANISDKPVRKRKKATDGSEKSNEQPLKKFPHSTRRRNRSISKSLLETPEDEIDHLSLPIKDLIMLAEHRERQNKEVDTRPTATPVEEVIAPVVEPVKRTSNNFWEDNPYDYDEDDVYNSGQAEGSFRNPSTSTVTRDTAYFNYHSHMDKTPRVKWTKQDTELFYEGLRQFGSDLSMIQHLFPGRTRHQIKLKYKKEERQQPMKLLEALTNRSKDLSHYKLVIGRLQEQIDREEEQQRAEEEALGATGNEGSPEEATADDTQQEKAQDEAAKSEQDGDGLGAVQEPDEATKIGSPTASNDELDMDDWSAYKSDF